MPVRNRVGWGLLLVLVCAGGLLAQGEEAAVTQNAVLEGIQMSSEPGTDPAEKVVSCYFIFRDKPSSFFYEIRSKEKKLVFDFNDTKKGGAPLESMSEQPIKGFTVEETKVNVNEDVGGLEPEWHNRISVIFSLDQIPIITVNEEYSVISFSYKWCTDPNKCEQYVQKEKKNGWLIGGLAGAGGLVAGGVVLWLVLRDNGGGEEPEQPLSTDDLPVHRPHPDLP